MIFIIPNMRLPELDFLRGIAVVFVVLQHSRYLFKFKVGWLGVDLFFVLSGFLVSSLLYKEFIKFNKINIFSFLVRRGLKIYPTFYITLLVAILLEFQRRGEWPPYYQIFAELLFLQSYIKNILDVSWSLAVEEHFYILLALSTLIATKFKILSPRLLMQICIGIFMICLFVRAYNYLYFPYKERTHHFPTHLRIDSLLFGVLIGYFYHFKLEILKKIEGNSWLVYVLLVVSVGLVLLFGKESFIVNTIGDTLLYISFGGLLVLFLIDKRMLNKLNSIFSESIVNLLAYIGFYSYGIYLWHIIVAKYFMPVLEPAVASKIVLFAIYVLLSIFFGILISKIIEQPFLRLRDRYFPPKTK